MNDTHLPKDAISLFNCLEKNIASHAYVLDTNIYPQPSTYLTMNYVCMKMALNLERLAISELNEWFEKIN